MVAVRACQGICPPVSYVHLVVVHCASSRRCSQLMIRVTMPQSLRPAELTQKRMSELLRDHAGLRPCRYCPLW